MASEIDLKNPASPYFFVNKLLAAIDQETFEKSFISQIKSLFNIVPYYETDTLLHLEKAAKNYPDIDQCETYQKEMGKRWFEAWKVGLYEEKHKISFQHYFKNFSEKQQKTLSVILWDHKINISNPPLFNVEAEAKSQRIEGAIHRFNWKNNVGVIDKYLEDKETLSKKESLKLFATIYEQRIFNASRYETLLNICRKASITLDDIERTHYHRFTKKLIYRKPELFKAYGDYFYPPQITSGKKEKTALDILDQFIKDQNDFYLENYDMGFVLIDNFKNILEEDKKQIKEDKDLSEETQKNIATKFFNFCNNFNYALQHEWVPITVKGFESILSPFEFQQFLVDPAVYLLKKYENAKNFDDVCAQYFNGLSYDDFFHAEPIQKSSFDLFQKLSQVYIDKKQLAKALPLNIEDKDKPVHKI